MADPRVHLLRGPHEVPREGELVVPVVEDEGAAPDPVDVLAPRQGLGRNLPRRLAPPRVALDADGEGLPDRALVDEGLRPDDGRVEDEVLEHPQGTARLLRRVHHAIGVGDARAHRLLDRDRLPGLERGEGRLEVEVVGEEDLDEVDRVERHQLAVVVGDERGVQAPRPRPSLRERRVPVAEGDDLGVGVGEVLDCVQIGDAAGSDEADANSVQVGLSSSVARKVSRPRDTAKTGARRLFVGGRGSSA